MIQNPQTDLRERYIKLPLELREALFSETTADKVFEIGKRYALMVNKVGEMASETGHLMLGVTHPDEFVNNLSKRLEVDKVKAKAIADDINREIFAPVREHLRAMFGTSEQGTGNRVEGIEKTKPIPQETTKKYQVSRMKYEGKEEIQKPSSFQASGSRLQEKENQKPSKPITYNLTLNTVSLEDLEAELKKTIAEEHGKEPLSVVRPTPSTPLTEQKIDVPRYTGSDPYREQVEDTMPNTKGAPYTPPTLKPAPQQPKINHEPTKNLLDSTGQAGIMNYGKNGEKADVPSPFSPLPPKPPSETRPDSYRESINPERAAGVKPDGTLKHFRGFNMTAQEPKQNKDKS